MPKKGDTEKQSVLKFEPLGCWGFEGWDDSTQSYMLVGSFRTYSISIVNNEDGEARLKDVTGWIDLGVFPDYYTAREKAWETQGKIRNKCELFEQNYKHKLGESGVRFRFSLTPRKTDQELLADEIWDLLIECLLDLKPWAEKALNNYDRQFILKDLPIKLDNFCHTKRDALLCAFDHSKSPEGYEYWENILWPKEQWFKEWPDSPLPG